MQPAEQKQDSGHKTVTMKAQAFWIRAPGDGVLHTETLPEPEAGMVQVRTLFSGISRGTESLVFQGRVPVSEAGRMRAPFQAGDFPGPVKYGYANVGVVESGPPDLEGCHVFCLYPHQDRYVVPATAVFPLPNQLPPERAVLAANMETAVNGLWDAAPRIGDRIAVIGAGTTGMLTAALAARIPGTQVQLIDIDPAKAEAAETLGLTLVQPEAAQGEVDLVIHATGYPDALRQALDLAGFEATVLEMSWYGAQDVPAPLGGAFHAKRLTLASSQVGSISPARRARWSNGDRLSLALRLLQDSRFDALITGECAFQDLPMTLRHLSAGPPGTLCYRVRYETSGLTS